MSMCKHWLALSTDREVLAVDTAKSQSFDALVFSFATETAATQRMKGPPSSDVHLLTRQVWKAPTLHTGLVGLRRLPVELSTTALLLVSSVVVSTTEHLVAAFHLVHRPLAVWTEPAICSFPLFIRLQFVVSMYAFDQCLMSLVSLLSLFAIHEILLASAANPPQPILAKRLHNFTICMIVVGCLPAPYAERSRLASLACKAFPGVRENRNPRARFRRTMHQDLSIHCKSVHGLV
mmetsp:Transcript_52166/g.124312  ORF Transcript_52166/g.124312 Transcript_52166/m.124312 type:complete len:235 (-) Transcript_52166:954-1658(-)